MSTQPETSYRFDEFELHPTRRTLSRNGEKISVAPKTFEVLHCLVANAGQAVTKEDLLAAVWPGAFVEESNLTQHIFAIRKALGNRSNLIATLPGRGYQFTAAVQTFTEVHDVQPAPTPRTTLTRNTYAATSAVIIVLCGLIGWGIRHKLSGSVPGDHHELVLAELENNTGDKAFDHILTRALQIDLEQSPYMDILNDRDFVSTLHLMGRQPDTSITPEIAREVCERTNRQVLLTGSITSVGNEYLLLLEATDCRTSAKLSAAKAEVNSKTKVLNALDKAAEELRARLGESASSVHSYDVPLAQATTPSLEALQAYSIGLALTAQGKDNAEIIPFFQHAIELDPNFAMAYSALGMRYYTSGEQRLAVANFTRALALSDHVSAKEKLIIESHFYSEGMQDIQRGIKNYKMWTVTYPHDVDPWFALGNMYFQLGQYPDSINAVKQAFLLRPDRPTYGLMTMASMRANRFEEAKAAAALAAQRGMDSQRTHWPSFFMAWRDQDQAALAREKQWADEHSADWYGWFYPANLADAYALSGRFNDAYGLLSKAYQKAESLKTPEAATSLLEGQADLEIVFGRTSAARATVNRIKPEYADEPTLVLLKTRLGDLSAAQKYLATHGNDTTSNFHTLVNIPQVKAVLAMQQNRPLDAISALEPTRPYELATDYSTINYRAQAYMQAHQPQMAILEYKKILANPGIDPIEAPYAVFHLGLARAYAAAGDTASARTEYQTALTAWKDADPNLPLVQQARTESAKLLAATH